MGFGLIAAGFSTLLFLRAVPAELIGFAVIVYALGKLCSYNKYFKTSRYFAYILLAFSVVDTVLWVLDIIEILSIEGIPALPYIHILLLLPFSVFLLMALKELCLELSFDKGVSRANIAMWTTITYYIINVINIAFPTVILTAVSFILFFLYLVTFELSLLICHKGITTDEAEEEENKKLEQFEKRFGKKKSKK